MKFSIKFFALISLFGGIAQAEISASKTTDGSHNTINVGASMQFPAGDTSGPKPKEHKPHRQPKRKSPDSAAIQKTVSQAGGSEPRVGTPDAKKSTPGNIDVLKGNDAGQFNRGSPDHVPGTTGTSGQ